MLDISQVIQGSSDSEEWSRDLLEEILEQRGKLRDRQINDELCRDLILQLVVAERNLATLNEQKNRFLGIAAHDLRNPLTVIRGMSELLIDDDLDEKSSKSFVKTIFQVSSEMFNLVNDLLDLSVIESGKFDLKLSECELNELIKTRVDYISLSAQKKQITLKSSMTATPKLQLDRNRINQVIDNLLTNALKFSEPGTTVTIATRTLSNHGAENAVEFSVVDQGQGIPEDELKGLFGSFQKLSVRPTGEEKSTGLGLSIVKKIVEAHSGKIAVTSKVGEGTTFSVSFPCSNS